MLISEPKMEEIVPDKAGEIGPEQKKYTQIESGDSCFSFAQRARTAGQMPDDQVLLSVQENSMNAHPEFTDEMREELLNSQEFKDWRDALIDGVEKYEAWQAGDFNKDKLSQQDEERDKLRRLMEQRIWDMIEEKKQTSRDRAASYKTYQEGDSCWGFAEKANEAGLKPDSRILLDIFLKNEKLGPEQLGSNFDEILNSAEFKEWEAAIIKTVDLQKKRSPDYPKADEDRDAKRKALELLVRR